MNSVDEGRFGPGNDEVHTILLRKSHEAGIVVALDIGIDDLVGRAQTSTTVSGSDIDNVDEGRLAKFPSQGMLTATVADNEDTYLFLSHCEEQCLERLEDQLAIEIVPLSEPTAGYQCPSKWADKIEIYAIGMLPMHTI